MPFLIFLVVILIRIGLLLAAAWLLTLAIPELITVPDSFRGWLGVLVAATIAIGGTTAKVNS